MDDIILLRGAPDGAPPHEFRIFGGGLVTTSKGVFIFDREAGERVMAAAEEWGNEYSLDYGHASVASGLFGPADPANAHKAAGWFRPELRGYELWARGVSWTPTAARMLANREYRYMSPAFDAESFTDSKGVSRKRIVRLLNVALTNMPATHGLEPLVASQDLSAFGGAERTTTMQRQIVINGIIESIVEGDEERGFLLADGTSVPGRVGLGGFTIDRFVQTKRQLMQQGKFGPETLESFRADLLKQERGG